MRDGGALLQTTGLRLNPRLPEAQTKQLTQIYNRYRGEFSQDSLWLATSGTTTNGTGSLVVLGRRALEVSAESVNRHMGATASDRWGLALPLFHIGGVMIPIRAVLSGASVLQFDQPWSPESFHTWLQESRISLLSLVPTQLFDLVWSSKKAPESLRAVVIGGGRLELDLLHRAKGLGWPVITSYGMTECASQIATGTVDAPTRLSVLSHVAVRLATASDILEIKSESLLDAKIDSDGVIQRVEPKAWYRTDDRVRIERNGSADSVLEIFGRASDVVKILGELVDLEALRAGYEEFLREQRWEAIGASFRIEAEFDARAGHRIVLTVNNGLALTDDQIENLIEVFNQRVAPVSRIQSWKRSNVPLTTWKLPTWKASP